MKILHLSTEDITGGAARAAHRLNLGLRALGHDSSMFVLNRRSKDPSVQSFEPASHLVSRLRRRWRRTRIADDFGRYRETRPDGFEIFSDDRSEFGTEVVRRLPSCDVINLHWIARYVDYEAFFSAAPKQTPVVWRIADMNPITGGCHYDEDCGKFLGGCGACPQLGSHHADDLSAEIWARKQRVFDAVEPSRLHFVALNRWMASNLGRHPIFRKFPVSIIPNGLDTGVFTPRNRAFARECLGLPPHVTIILFVAAVVQIRYKGFMALAEALSGLKVGKDVLLVSVGTKPILDLALPHTHLGQIVDDRLLALAYSAADMFVIPSLYDNSPNTVLEAMACGIPVVGFETSGVPDMVRHGMTGLLVPRGEVHALRGAIEDLLSDPWKREQMGKEGRHVALEEYTLSIQARRYSELYQSLK